MSGFRTPATEKQFTFMNDVLWEAFHSAGGSGYTTASLSVPLKYGIVRSFTIGIVETLAGWEEEDCSEVCSLIQFPKESYS